MTKRRETASCAEAIWTFIAAVGRRVVLDDVSEDVARAAGLEQAAQALGIGKGVMRAMLDPDRPEKLSLERAGQLSRLFDIDGLARWLAMEAGGTFVPLPQPSSDMEKLTAAGVRAAGETAAQIIEAHSEASELGRALSVSEAKRLRDDCARVVEIFGEIGALADKALRAAQREASQRRGR